MTGREREAGEADNGRTILHVDMDAFYTSVEQHDHPEYRGRPVVVGAPPDKRGVVAAASYEARRYGIRSAMPSREAGRRCPDAVFLPPNMRRYQQVSRHIHAVFERYTPLVEPLSIDEAFLDVTGSRRLFGTGEQIAARIKHDIRSETGLTASVGVAVNKFLAKLASDLEKPDGLTVVPRSREGAAAFLAPLPVGRIWGVGPVTQAALEAKGYRTIGDLQQAAAPALAALVGAHAAGHLLSLAWGADDREVETGREEKSLSREHTFDVDCRSPETVRGVLDELVEDVGRRLREGGLYAGVGRLKLRWAGFQTITRQRTFRPPVCDDFSLLAAAHALLEAEQPLKAVRLVGFGVGRLEPHAEEQLDLFAGEQATRGRHERLSQAVDAIRRRLGEDTIRRGSDRRLRDGTA